MPPKPMHRGLEQPCPFVEAIAENPLSQVLLASAAKAVVFTHRRAAGRANAPAIHAGLGSTPVTAAVTLVAAVRVIAIVRAVTAVWPIAAVGVVAAYRAAI